MKYTIFKNYFSELNYVNKEKSMATKAPNEDNGCMEDTKLITVSDILISSVET